MRAIVVTALLGLAVVPPTASAIGTWGGWSGEHYANVATLALGDPGRGDTRLCVAPELSTDDCSNALWTSPVVFTYVLVPVKDPNRNGCGPPEDPHPDTEPNPCDNGDIIGGFFVGTAPDGPGVGAQG